MIYLYILQADLDSLSQWAQKWQMTLMLPNMHISPSLTSYPLFHLSISYICNCAIQQVDSAKCLGVIITNNLSWSEHITKIINKANSTRAFLQRNLSQCQRSVKSTCYNTILEYASTIWSPHLLCDIYINRIEMVQRQSARFVYNDFTRTSSVTSMLNNLQLGSWPLLRQRRDVAKVTLFFDH